MDVAKLVGPIVSVHDALAFLSTSSGESTVRRKTRALVDMSISVVTALHCMQRGPSDRKSVRLSVCLSVCHGVNCDKTKAPSEKSSIMTNRKSPTTLPMSLR